MLFWVADFREHILSLDGSTVVLLRELQELFAALQGSERKFVSPKRLVDAFLHHDAHGGRRLVRGMMRSHHSRLPTEMLLMKV